MPNSTNLKTERLTIIPFALALVEATLRDKEDLKRLLSVNVPDEWPGPDYTEILPFKAGQLEKDPDRSKWGRLIVHTADQRIIGDIGFKGGPDPEGTAEIGYSVVPAYRRLGYAVEAARAMLDWAFSEAGVKRVVAECLDDNVGSIKILEKLGMRRLEPNGEMLKWEIRKEDWLRR